MNDEAENPEIGKLVRLPQSGALIQQTVAELEQAFALADKILKEREKKRDWLQRDRATFKADNGYSKTSHYACGGLRKAVLERDGFKCVRCGMTDAEHKQRWQRPITVDHKDKNRKNNKMDNLQTLCLHCHGNKDLLPRLRAPKFLNHKEEAIRMKLAGYTYQQIADRFGFSVAIPWKWLRIWKKEAA